MGLEPRRTAPPGGMLDAAHARPDGLWPKEEACWGERVLLFHLPVCTVVSVYDRIFSMISHLTG